MGRRDEAAFTEFAAAARPRLRSTAYLLCGDWHQASDHTQEALIRVYVAWPRLRRHGSELAYARKAVVSAFIDARRRRSSTEVPTGEQPAASATGADLATTVATRTALMDALARPPRRQRACVVLRFFDDLSVAQTAAALGCSEGNVKSQTSRALGSLRSMFEGTSLGDLLAVGEGDGSWSTS